MMHGKKVEARMGGRLSVTSSMRSIDQIKWQIGIGITRNNYKLLTKDFLERHRESRKVYSHGEAAKARARNGQSQR